MLFIIRDITHITQKTDRAVRLDNIDDVYDAGDQRTKLILKDGRQYTIEGHFPHMVMKLNKAFAELEKNRNYLAPSAAEPAKQPGRPHPEHGVKPVAIYER